ncbi:MAG: hypothetical protein B6D59_01285 [Campylobacteraceae bacterium 4484_4]|nr:MAG: hypothetical protein B6D59_01285 [Campylobacteraceae bacterium 4484_4]
MKKFDSINVIPFIDIMLVLLAIVLVTSTFIAKGILPVNLPKSSSQTTIEPKSIMLVIDAEGKLYLEHTLLTEKELLQKLGTFPKTRAIMIHCDKKSAFEHFVRLLDRLKQQGFENISIVTEQE